ncbi:MAG: FkbM family methyltransferase [Butyrivibrio sp.]|nr:FkbM family methyltransferase [Butyrivibrio sp.]
MSMKNVRGGVFKGKAYLLDPDESNQKQISQNCQYSEADIKRLQIGAWNQRDFLAFQSDENQRTAGKIADSGNIVIQVDAIDNIVKKDKVDFIKMDIEGAELNALRGAAETIMRDHPVLAVCVYHKREDLLEIPEYIHSLCKEYKFYIRAYGGPYSIEVVFFAVVR